MIDSIDRFEALVRRARHFTEQRSDAVGGMHPFAERDIHPGIPVNVRELFDDGHYSQATFEVFKFVDKEVQRHSAVMAPGSS